MSQRAPLLLFLVVLGLSAPATGQHLTRGPYLQDARPDGMVVAWNTSHPSTGLVRISRQPGPPWEQEQTDGVTSLEHAVTFTNLAPDTRYYYEVVADATVLATGSDYYFETYPQRNSPRPFRFLAWGDSGTGDPDQYEVAQAMDAIRPRPELGLGIGDLVYPNGEWQNYDPRYFEPYAPLLRNLVIWPAMGNHDAYTQSGAPYLANFYLPTQSGAPGSPSGTELYYSFDYGLAHFICLDSQLSDRSVGGPMYNWALADLQAAQARGARWIIAFFHHPPYTKGTHNSDSTSDSGGRLVDMHDIFVPMLEAHGADLVLSGHSHVYERSFLVKDDFILQNDPAHYTKVSTPDGTIYVVTGCGGKSGSGSLNHPLMAVSVGNVVGNTIIDVSHETLHGFYLLSDGSSIDLFSLTKASDTRPPQVADVQASGARPREVLVRFDEPVQAGSGSGGAEHPSSYTISGGIGVSAARLESDGRTVVLTTDPHALRTGYTLRVSGVADRATFPNTATDAEQRYLLKEESGIPAGAVWRYAKGTSFPGAMWADPGFADSHWLTGPVGIGYGDGDDATVLNDMENNYVTVYLRNTFEVPDPASVTGFTVDILYDDGFVGYLNGTEVIRVGVPAGQDHTTRASTGHEANNFEHFDLMRVAHFLAPGTNTLAFEVHNVSSGSSDLSFHPIVKLQGGGGGNQPPVAIADSDLTTANAPATVHFSAAASHDPDGSIALLDWHFGDGGAGSTDVRPTHTFSEAGEYVVTLRVRDDQGAESLARRIIQVHTHGQAPTVAASASQTAITPGGTVTFSGQGSDPDGGAPLRWEWEFDDPASPDPVASTQQASHTFQQDGTYLVRLRVTDDEGSQAAETLTITVGSGVGGGSGGSGSGGSGSSGGASGGSNKSGGGGGGGCGIGSAAHPMAGASWLLLLMGGLLVLRRRRQA